VARETEQGKRTRGEWRHIASGGGLVAIVVAILLMGALHETARTPDAARSELEARGDVPPPAPELVPESLISAPPEAPQDLALARSALDPLSRRTLEDPIRLARSSGTFTLQIAVACRKETASRILNRATSSERLFVLPATVRDQECFRFCWGSYATLLEARKAADLPAALRAGLNRPTARRIDEVGP